MDELMHEARALRRRAIFHKEAERIANRVSKALDGAYLKPTDEDDIPDYLGLMWKIGQLLVVHHCLNDNATGAKWLAEGLMEGLEEWCSKAEMPVLNELVREHLRALIRLATIDGKPVERE